MLATHPEIHTNAEPWLMLPLAQAAGHHNGLSMDYQPELAAAAIADFAQGMPGKMRGLRRLFATGLDPWISRTVQRPQLQEAGPLGKLLARLDCTATGRSSGTLAHAIGSTVRQAYAAHGAQAGSSATLFLDKTPRYYLIADYLAEAFPDAKFILLWRDPLDNLASFYSTWLDHGVSVRSSAVDLMHGPTLMARAARSLGPRAWVMDYDRLLRDPQVELNSLLAFLELPFPPDLLHRFESVRIPGCMGDPNRDQSAKLRPPIKDGWKKTFNTPARRRLAGEWVAALPDEVRQAFAVDRAALLDGLGLPKAVPSATWEEWLGMADAVRLPRPRETSAERRRRRMKSWLPHFLRPA